MTTIARLGLIAYIIYIPIFVVLLIFAAKRYKGYSFSSFWISNLGDTRFESARLFNISLFLYGFFSIFFVYTISSILPNLLISKITTVLMYFSSFSTMLTSFIPFNKNTVAHHNYSNIIYYSMIGTLILLPYPLYLINDFPHAIFVLNVLMVFIVVLFIVSYLPIEKKLGRIPENLVDFRKEEKSFFIRNSAVWQWIFLSLSVCWNFVMAIATLRLT